jgi:mono/diheme cytochrome c family protein/plastocyanin
MTDQGREPEQRLPVPRPDADRVPARADRFTAPAQIQQTGGLTPERAAKIVRQSGNARWTAFLAVTVVALFVIVYYFYETGLPYGLTTPRLQQQADLQQVTSIERGYDLFEANCARCHGASGQGGIGPVLNDQVKLFAHLNPTYIKNVLTVGGRYVCGNPNSVMPIWADTNGGPLNYIQIQDLINFIRAPSNQTFTVRNPSLNEPVLDANGNVETFHGWVDPSFAPAPSSTPFPDCWSGAVGGTTPSTGPAPSISASDIIGTVVAQNIAFDVKTLTATANKAFGIDFQQKDSGVGGHDIEIKDSNGNVVFTGDVLTDPGETTYVVQGLPAGTYTFICKIHPIPAMTGTLTVH